MNQYQKYKLDSVFTVTDLVNVSYYKLPRSYEFPGESHDFWEFIYIDKGELVVTAGASKYLLKAGELAFIAAGPWNEPDYKNAGVNYDIQLIPSYDENGYTGGLQGWDFMYGVNTGDEGRNEAIRGWLKKMGSFEVQQKFAQVIGRSMLRQDAMDAPETQQTEMLTILAKGLKCGMNQMDFGHSSVFWTSAIADVAPSVANGSITPEQAAEQFIEGINGLYAEAGE